MITKDKIIDDLITKLLTKYNAQGSNISRSPSLFMEEALQFQEKSPFLNINSYLYFLSEMSVLLLTLKNGNFVMFYGLDNWDEGLNILDFPIPGENGYHLVMDITSADGEILYFAYNAKFPKENTLWVARDVNATEGTYSKTQWNFVDILNMLTEDKIDFKQLRNSTNHV